MRLALVSTVKSLTSTFLSWCDYHLKIFDKLFIWIDDPMELGSPFVPADPRIEIALGAQIRSGSIHGDLMYRQDANASATVKICLASGIEWLCHLDSDELLFTSSREQLEQEFEPDCGQVRFSNHEAWPVWESDNFFLECLTFKRNGKHAFNFYANGKAAVRCSSAVQALDAHRFTGFSGRSRWSSRFCVLHYPCATFKLWCEKYRTLGPFPDFWWDDRHLPIKLPFHLISRDLYAACLRMGDFSEAEQFFRRQLLTAAQRDALLRQEQIFTISRQR